MKTLALSFVPALLVAAFMSIAIANSQKGEPPKYSTTVKLAISGDDEIRNEVYSYISRELRSLSDVQIVKDKGEWVIQVVALQEQSKTGRTVGVAISSVTLKPLLRDRYVLFILLPQIRASLSDTDYQHLLACLLESQYVRGHQVYSGSPEDLKTICQKIVANFDANSLKEAREDHQEIVKLLWSEELSTQEEPNKPKAD